MVSPSTVTLRLLSSVLLVTLDTGSASVRITLPSTVHRADAKVVLHIDELKLPPHASGIVRVFADLPSADATTDTDDEHFLGYVTVLAKTSAEAARGVQANHSITLDISHKKRLLADRKAITITIVPLGPTSATASAGRVKPTFARVYVAHN
jgi:hypothetical protein